MEDQNLIGSRNLKIRSKILDDFLSYRNNNNNLNCVSGFLANAYGKKETLDLDFKCQNDDLSSETSVEYSPKRISEKYEVESLNDNYSQSIDSVTGSFGNEKNDTPKTKVAVKGTAETNDHFQALERIAKILEVNKQPSRILQAEKTDIMESLRIPATQCQHDSYLVFFLLLSFFILFSILKVSFYTLDLAKRYFEKGLILNWSWMKKHFSMSESETDRNLFTFLIISPILILFLISYTGLYILFLLHKIVLDSVPNAIYTKISCRNWFQKLWTKTL